MFVSVCCDESVLSASFKSIAYRIAGNFYMVQNLAFFVDRLGAEKIRTVKSEKT
jgi:hypothetical protein